MWHQFFSAFALVLILEGVLPFLCPDCWRDFLRKVMVADGHSIRIIGLISMLLGLALLFYLHG